MTTTNRFDVKDPGEKELLFFDFSLGLSAGETLQLPVTVSIGVVNGADPTPASMLAGGNFFNPGNLVYVVPVQGGLDLTDYDIVVKAATSNPAKVLVLGGILPVRAQ